MKRTFLFILALLGITTARAQSFTLITDIWNATLVCNKQTWDDILDADGRGDEIFVQNFLIVADTNGVVKQRLINANLDIKMMMTGGTYPLNKPLFSGHPMQDDEFIIIVPVVWEEDKLVNKNVVTAFNANMNTCLDMIAQQAAPLYAEVIRKAIRNTTGGPFEPGIFIIDRVRQLSWNSFTGLPRFKTLLAPVSGVPGTRPVGMTPTGEFIPSLVILSKYQLQMMGQPLDAREKAVSNFTFAPNYNETALGNTTDHGDYTVVMTVRKSGAPQPAEPVSAPPIIINGTINQPPINTAIRPFTIKGVWSGTWESQTSSTVFYSLRMNADGTLEVLDKKGAAVARGTYTYTNNTLNTSYVLDGGNFTVTGTYDANTKILSGTWKQPNNIGRSNGIWSLRKN